MLPLFMDRRISMGNYITVDGGTTNTRLSLVKDRKVMRTIKLPCGARSGIDNGDSYRAAVREAISELRGDAVGENIHRILASGMITSEFGLYNLPHISAPAGIAELHAGMCETILPDISDIPFVFIPGIKISGGELEHTDMMRGEEAELVGLTETPQGGCMYILPGSHSKLITTDAAGRICKFTTMLTGEMISALAQGTILKDAVDLTQSTANDTYLIKGYEYCEAHGLNEALFKVRILKNLFGAEADEVYSFFLGAVLYGEVSKAAAADENKIIIGGREQIKKAMCTLLRHVCGKEITEISKEAADIAPTMGVISIFEYGK